MTRIDELPADQQAVLRLLRTQGRSYDEIARTLRMAPAGVRDRAQEALSSLGPAHTALSAERRAELADHLLGQQSPADQQATSDYLADTPGARGWARAVAGELEPLGGAPLPDLEPQPKADVAHDAAPTRSGEAVVPAATTASATKRTREADPASRRAGAALLIGTAVVAALAIGFFTGRATKDSSGGGATASSKTSSTSSAAPTTVLGQANLSAPSGAPAPKALGITQFVRRSGKQLINVIAEGLPQAPRGSGYGVWLTGNNIAPVWLGYFQAVSSSGQVGAQNPLPVDPSKYTTVLLTRQRGKNPTSPSVTFLSGAVRLRG